MSKTFFRCLLATYLTLPYLTHAAEYGIGFGLSLDYSTASLYYSNGSTIDVAKIEGGPAYKLMMRAPDVLRHDATSDRTSSENAPKPAFEAVHIPLKLDSFRHYLPPWLGGKDPHAQPLSRMLQALRTATESYLETSVSSVEVVFPFPVSDSYLDNLRSACSFLSLHLPLSAPPPGGILAARARGIGGECPYDISKEPSDPSQRNDQEQLILTIDYSRAALTALLIDEECGVFEDRRVLHETSLGTDGLATHPNTSRNELAHAVREITDLPLKDGNGASLMHVNELVLIGESASNQQLQDVLKEVLGEHFSRLVTKDRRTRVIHPLFAASAAVAQDCWDRMGSSGYKYNVEL